MRLLPLLTASLIMTATVNAAENEAVYINNQEKLVIPYLVIGNDIYYAQLDRNADSYDFSLDLANSVLVTPQPGDDWADALEVVGTWSPEGSETAVTIAADGTYSWDAPAQGACPAGVESGTWTLDSDTGVLFFRALTDENGECGLSHPKGAIRVSRDGDNLVATLSRRQAGQQVDTDITLVPAAE